MLALTYSARVDIGAVPNDALEATEHSATSGEIVADALGSTGLVGVVSDAFGHRPTATLRVAAGDSAACASVSTVAVGGAPPT